MKYDEFIQRVQELAGVQTSDEALRLTQAVLETLGERLYRTEQSQMAAQLPKGIKELFVARQPPENTRRDVQGFSLEEFYHRVSARSGVSYPKALKQTKAVMAVLQEAVTSGQIEDVRRELPAEFDELFEPMNGE
ncbi:MAG: DUF2267 domain-containing protein [Chloroflexi bacterium]|nr:MAG: DUF2267 domain-containing protein [Chloroflexota bacterium]